MSLWNGVNVGGGGGEFDITQFDPDDVATELATGTTAEAVGFIQANLGSPDFLAAVFDSTNVTAANLATWCNDTGMDPDKLALVFCSKGLGSQRAEDILGHANLSANNTYNILRSGFEQDKIGLIKILRGSDTDITRSSTTSSATLQRAQDYTVNTGVTYTLTDDPSLVLCRNLTISGTGILKQTNNGGAGGTQPLYANSDGFPGGGGLFIFVEDHIEIDAAASIIANGQAGENGTSTSASGDGGDATGGSMYVIVPSSTSKIVPNVGIEIGPGNGGHSGGYGTVGSLREQLPGLPGGGAGGEGSSYIGGDGGTIAITYVTQQEFEELAFLGAIYEVMNTDWSKTPTNAVYTALPTMEGGGGGAGGIHNTYAASGAGGSSGGAIYIFAYSIDNNGSISAIGGAGGNSGTEGARDKPGGGGGGGYVISNTKYGDTGTIDLSGGAHGTESDLGEEFPTYGRDGVPYYYKDNIVEDVYDSMDHDISIDQSATDVLFIIDEGIEGIAQSTGETQIAEFECLFDGKVSFSIDMKSDTSGYYMRAMLYVNGTVPTGVDPYIEWDSTGWATRDWEIPSTSDTAFIPIQKNDIVSITVLLENSSYQCHWRNITVYGNRRRATWRNIPTAEWSM